MTGQCAIKIAGGVGVADCINNCFELGMDNYYCRKLAVPDPDDPSFQLNAYSVST